MHYYKHLSNVCKDNQLIWCNLSAFISALCTCGICTMANKILTSTAHFLIVCWQRCHGYVVGGNSIDVLIMTFDAPNVPNVLFHPGRSSRVLSSSLFPFAPRHVSNAIFCCVINQSLACFWASCSLTHPVQLPALHIPGFHSLLCLTSLPSLPLILTLSLLPSQS